MEYHYKFHHTTCEDENLIIITLVIGSLIKFDNLQICQVSQKHLIDQRHFLGRGWGNTWQKMIRIYNYIVCYCILLYCIVFCGNPNIHVGLPMEDYARF